MCVDYIDLNTTCLMDHFLLPHIDQLVDVSASNELLSGWLLGQDSDGRGRRRQNGRQTVGPSATGIFPSALK